MICLNYNINYKKYDSWLKKIDIKELHEMRHGIFNNAALKGEYSGMVKDAFQYQSDDERHSEFEKQIEQIGRASCRERV